MKNKKLQFDNPDSRIRYYELMLERSLDNIPEYALPPGYRFVFYRQGDRDSWIRIEQSAKEFSSYEQGLDAWNRYYGGREHTLLDRMVFAENAEGKKIATATAYYDISGRDQSGDAWLHWVAADREYQGRGLSKPLITHVLGIMRKLGYTHVKIPTQTTTWVACRIYLDLGFVPVPQNAASSRDGWNMIKALTNHPALESYDAAAGTEMLLSNRLM